MRKGLENVVAPILIGAAALVGSTREAKAHTNDPTFYILYAQANQVIWSDPSTLNPSNTNIWRQNYTAYAPGFGGFTNDVSLKILVGFFINTGTNSPVDDSSKMNNTTYNYVLTDVTKSNKFTVTQGIVATNGVWQGKSFAASSPPVIDKTINNLGVYGKNTVNLNTGDGVFGESLSSAIQISLNALQMARDETLAFQPVGTAKIQYIDSSIHAYNDSDNYPPLNFIDSGSILFIPEPSSAALFASGCAALGAYHSRRRNKK